MKIKIKKWGNDLAIQIPESITIDAHLEANSEVYISLVDRTLVTISSIDKNYTLEKLLSNIIAENIYSTKDTGNSVGNET